MIFREVAKGDEMFTFRKRRFTAVNFSSTAFNSHLGRKEDRPKRITVVDYFRAVLEVRFLFDSVKMEISITSLFKVEKRNSINRVNFTAP